MWLFKRLVRDISTPPGSVLGVAREAMLCLALGLSPGLAPAAAQEDGPSAVIDRLHATLLEVMMAAKELGYNERYMTRIATATAWRDMTAQQQTELVALFTEMSIANYAARFDGFGGEAF